MGKIKQLTSEYKDFFIKYKKQISFITIVIVAIFVRVYWFGKWPPFVNQGQQPTTKVVGLLPMTLVGLNNIYLDNIKTC